MKFPPTWRDLLALLPFLIVVALIAAFIVTCGEPVP